MSHPAFDALWGEDPPKKADPFDAVWNAPHPASRPASKPTDANNQPTEQELAAAAPSPGVLGHLVNIAQGIPGGELAQRGLRQLTHGESPEEALAAIHGATKKISKPVAIAERIAGSLPLIKLPIKSPAGLGATIGAADGALSADPDKDVSGRASDALTGGVLGGVLGKGTEVVGTLGRSLLGKSAASNLFQREAARDAVANTDFSRATLEGNLHGTDTPEIRAWLAQPDVAEVHQGLMQNRAFAGKSPHDPEVLKAVYQVLGDQQQQLERGLAAPTPNRPNLGRFTKRDLDLAKGEGMNAMAGATPGAGPMPSFRTANQNFAQATGGMNAVRKGEDQLRSALNLGTTTGKNLDRTTPEAFADWANGASQPERDAAGEGVLGATRENFLKHPVKNIAGAMVGHGALSKAAGLQRIAGSSSQSLTDLLTKLGLISANASAQP